LPATKLYPLLFRIVLWSRSQCINRLGNLFVGVIFILKKNIDLNITDKDVLIIADVQKDFLPGGALGIKNGDQIIPALNDYIDIFKKAKAKIVASRDWHPPNHVSFKEQGGQWSPHCVQETDGAQFSPNLKLPNDVTIISKATDPNKEAYSVFDSTGLADQLKAQGITRIFIGGLATDYCIVNSVVDAKNAGLDSVVLADATCGIDATPGDVDRAFKKMAANGAVQVTLVDFPELETPPIKENPHETTTDLTLVNKEIKRKARMRSKGTIKVPREGR